MRLALAQHVEVAAGAELGEEAGPAVPLGDAVEPRQEGVVHGLEDLALRARAALLVAALQLLPVHHLGGHQHYCTRAGAGLLLRLDLGKVDAADVPRAEPPQEADVGEGDGPEARDYLRRAPATSL